MWTMPASGDGSETLERVRGPGDSACLARCEETLEPHPAPPGRLGPHPHRMAAAVPVLAAAVATMRLRR